MCNSLVICLSRLCRNSRQAPKILVDAGRFRPFQILWSRLDLQVSGGLHPLTRGIGKGLVKLVYLFQLKFNICVWCNIVFIKPMPHNKSSITYTAARFLSSKLSRCKSLMWSWLFPDVDLVSNLGGAACRTYGDHPGIIINTSSLRNSFTRPDQCWQH